MAAVLGKCLALLVLLAPLVAGAVPLTLSDCVARNPGVPEPVSNCGAAADNVYLSAAGTSNLSYTHDLSDEGLLTGDRILSAQLSIVFDDDADVQNESVDIYVDFDGNASFDDSGERVARNFDPAGATFLCEGSCASALLDALSGGTVTLRLAVGSMGGVPADFYFSHSLLTAQVDRAPTGARQLSEPGALSLLGAVLFGIALTTRRRHHG